MARIRTIKPEFFLDEELCGLSLGHRLLFIGLWTLADRNGRMAFKPKTIKAILFPWDELDVESMLLDLAAEGFLEIYDHDGAAYMWIPKFEIHQRPHPKEAEGDFPDPKAGTTREIKRQAVKRFSVNPYASAGKEILESGKEILESGKELPEKSAVGADPPHQAVKRKALGAPQEFAAWVDERRMAVNPRLPDSILTKDQWARLGGTLKAYGRKTLEPAWALFERDDYAQRQGLPLGLFVSQAGDWVGKAIATPGQRPLDGIHREPPPTPETPAEKAWREALERLRSTGRTYIADLLANSLTPKALDGQKLVLSGDKFAIPYALENFVEVLAELGVDLVQEAGAA